MGNTNTLSINDDVRPYGMIYDLMRNYSVPIKWVIDQAKAKDGADFAHNGIVYRGGTFIIPAQFRSAVVNSRIAFWQTQGVVGATSVSDFTAYVYKTLVSVPKWTLDAANGSIAQAYLTAAGITNTGFSLGAYNWKAVSALDCCDDFFVMPHADPTWATHNRLFSWNKDCLGSIWAACHAVSALENSINPANTTQQMNFLSTRTNVFTPTPWPNNSLKLWGTHSGGSVPYSFNTNKASDPVAQYMGVTDLSQLNGSEQIYIPKQSTDPGGATRWRPGSNIIAFDPTQVNVPAPDLANGNVAATIVYGRAFDDNNRGFVMYEAGHSHLKGTASDGPALRAFFNFSFFQVQPKAPQLGAIGGFTPTQLVSSATPLNLSISATSPLTGITFSYLWRATNSAGTPVGSFSNATSATTTYTPPSVAGNTDIIISCVVTDNCGRASFQSGAVIAVPPPRPPVPVADAATVQPECGPATVVKDVLANDTDPDGDPLTLTLVNGNAGSFTTVNGGTVSFTNAGVITYSSAEGFTGTETLVYTVCDNTSPTPLCVTANYVITVGDPNKVPTAVNDNVTIAEDAIATISVLTNDVQAGGYTGGTITLRTITQLPSNGRVSVNTDGTVTYIPNADFAGTDQFRYQVINTSGYVRTALVTVTVTNDGCDAGTLQVTPPSSGSVTLTMTTGASGNADTYINQDGTPGGNSTRNYGTCVDISVNRRNGGAAMRGLTKFNLSAIPAGAVVTSATLRLYLNREGGAAYDISVHKVLEDWSEGTLCNNNGVANWTVRSGTTTNWTTAGGVFGTALATTNIPRTTGVYYQWTGLQATVNEWLASPSTNYGFLLKAVTENIADDRFEFDSREATNKPQLVINYTIPAVCAAIPNRAPLANNDFGYTTINTSPLVISNVKANDSDDGAFNVTGATLISGGGTVGTITNDGFTYTPVAGTTGTVVVEYTISDGTLTDVARVEIVVTGTPIDAVNDNPAPANSGVVQNINVMANDVDPENQKGILTIVTQPANGTAVVNDNGTPANFADDFITYTPAPGFYGTDNFTYQVCENPPAAICPVPAVCDVATVTVTVLNQPPVANNDNVTVLPCLPTTINLISNDTDPEAGAITITSISALSNPAAGTLVNNNDGTVTFTPATGFTGSVSFTYTIQDNV
ncbi:MAG TPA: Ig-like domain-containing protein, partial [Lacibacter sp.]|nr:Ig-like domain-containing protein [Lacibacter sp.]